MKRATGVTNGGEGCLVAIVIAVVFVVMLAFKAWVLKWAWQLVLVPVFGLTPITFWQAVAACFLLSIVGTAFRSSGGSKS